MLPLLLRAFRHSLVIDIAMLKSAAPSWKAGRVLDFAGLMCLPFLLAMITQEAPGLGMLAARSVGEVFRAIANEFLIALAVGLVNFLGLSMVVRILTAKQPWPGIQGRAAWLFRDGRIVVILLVLLAAVWAGMEIRLIPRISRAATTILLMFVAGLAPSLTLIWSSARWRCSHPESAPPEVVMRIRRRVLLSSVAIPAAALVGFLVWGFGLVDYIIAMLLVMFVALEILASTGVWIQRTIYQSGAS